MHTKLRALSEAEQNYERQRHADQSKVSAAQNVDDINIVLAAQALRESQTEFQDGSRNGPPWLVSSRRFPKGNTG